MTTRGIAKAIARVMRRAWRRERLYTPKSSVNAGMDAAASRRRMTSAPTEKHGRKRAGMRLTDRDWKIFKEYSGTNRRKLCDRYQISPKRLYATIAACRKASTQKPLPAGVGLFDSKFARYMVKNAHLGFKRLFLLNANAARLADREWFLLTVYLLEALSRRGRRGAK